MEKELLYTTKEVFDDYLKIDEKDFYYNIPLYQRGYKWKKKDVIKLLDDINRFKAEGSKFYCLQNITIVSNEKSCCFNIVDGQQRLTTMSIILGSLGKKDIVKNRVKFPKNTIREKTNEFLNNKILSEEDFYEKIESLDWSKYIENEANSEFDHQDIYHLFEAFKTVNKWLRDNDESISADELKEKILNNVKFIVNLIESEEGNEEEKIFANLNSKKIPLDGADLIRALIITNVAKEEENQQLRIKNIVRINETRIKIGMQLDLINSWWSKDEVFNYFKRFTQLKSEEIAPGHKLFNENKHRINLLYLLWAAKKQKSSLNLETIEAENISVFYKEILALHNILKEWFEDREMYHLLGFLFFMNFKNKDILLTIFKKWENDKTSTKKGFIAFLKIKIKENMSEIDENGEALPNYADTKINWYKDKKDALLQALVLMDVIHLIKHTEYSKMPVEGFNKALNHFEHIFPQNPEKTDDKIEYIDFLNNHVIKQNEKKIEIPDKNMFSNDEEYAQKLDELISPYVAKININSIGNLVLLDGKLNQSLSNKSYQEKRLRIVKHFNKGNFIQPHTFKVFVRYFNGEDNGNNEFEYWSNNDIEANAEAINKNINEFLKVEDYE
jgi:uncharacterized protein with ParB-like and HNH nuclease domain